MVAWRNRIVRFLPAAALALLLVDLAAIPLMTDEAPPVLPPAGEVLPGAAPCTFAVVGDSRGNENIYDAVIQGIQQDGAAFVLHCGDLVEHCAAKDYAWLLREMAEQNLKVPFCAVPGNHDIPETDTNVGGNSKLLLYERSFGQPHYWFAYGDSLFVALDTSDTRLREDELAWLDRTLTLHRSQFKTCFVFTHVPPRNPPPGRGHDLGAGGDRLMAMLEKWHVTALFAGHLHDYVEDRIRGVPIYDLGGTGAEKHIPDDHMCHYLLCRVDAEGNLSVQKKDRPAPTRADYFQYVCRVKVGRTGLRGLAAGLLLIALIHGWLARRRGGSRQQPAGS